MSDGEPLLQTADLAGVASSTVKVLFPLPLSRAYDYAAPAGAPPPAPGTFVVAPLGPRFLTGVVWADGADDADDPPPASAKLKAVERVIEAPPLPDAVMAFVQWVAAYTMFPAGAVLRLVMRSGDALKPVRPVAAMVATGVAPSRLTPAREKALAAAVGAPQTVRALADAAGVSDAVVRGLEKAGALKRIDIDPDAPFEAPDLARPGKALSPAQTRAAAQARSSVAATAPAPLLIDGVTGSGKTEVYLEAAAAALAADPTAQVLILLPEIALTLPFLDRVAERFGARPAAWHSDIKQAERRRVWRRALDGGARLFVGARSALFLPYKNLKMIIVDEEHESAYKQEDGVVYHGRDMAVARGALGGFPVLLASATPALETVVNVDQGRYDIARMTDRFGGAHMPDVGLIDLRRDAPEPGAWLSPNLIAATNETLKNHQQTLFFINRRGYAPLTICRKCGHRMKAPDSDTWLVEHRFENRLVCHHTGFSMPKPSACPACKAVGSLAACGPGVERVAEEVKARWPDARSAVLSSDTVQSAAAMRVVLEKMRDGAIDILVATQVVAKGHHFPGLTLVGVVDADMGLAGGDLRAAERTYQLLSQVAGRAGRAAAAGRALLQTHQPDAPVMRALATGDRDAFLAAEAASREATGFPPYGRLAAIVLRSSDETTLKAAADAHRRAAPRADGVEVWGPAPAPLYRLRGEARIRFLVKARRDVHLQRFVDAWLGGVKLRGPVRRTVDIDPYTFL
ncbi:MAG: primosomal protein N' [Pseudomonadota bacterium]